MANYIAAVSSDGTYLVDQNGNPRMMMGEDIWGIAVNSGRWNSGNYQSTFDTYFSQRAAQGFTAAEISLISTGDVNEPWVFGDGRDWDGTWPFNGSADPTTTANSTFWARRDYMFSSAAANGITIVVSMPGVGPQSPGAQLPWSNTQWSAYGTFLGNRYKTQGNIIWSSGDGIFAAGYWTGLSNWLTALRATGDTHVVTYQGDNETSSRYGFGSDNAGQDPVSFAVNAQFDWSYSYNVSYQGLLDTLANTPSASDVVHGRIPIVWGDGYYLASNGFGTDGQIERNMIWWALTSGACGASIGNNDIFGWDTGASALVTGSWYTSNIPGITTTFAGLPGWWKLRPDSSSTLVTSGRGTKRAAISHTQTGAYTGSPVDAYVTAAYAADGSLAVIYGATAFSITINQSVMKAGYTAKWIDPASGAATGTATGSSYSSSGLGNNSQGFADWLLVLQGPPSSPPPPPVILRSPPVSRPAESYRFSR